MKIKKIKNMLALAIAFIFFSGCAKSDNIKLGGVFSLSGDYYLDGQENKKGVELAIAQRPTVMDKKVKFIFKNDKSERMQTMNAYNNLAADKNIFAILGGGNSILSQDIASVSQKNKLPVVFSTASANSITGYGDNLYRIGCSDAIQGICMANFAIQDLNVKTAAVLYDSGNNYSVVIAKAFINAFNKNGGKILTQQIHSSSDTDFKTQLNKIKALEPEVLFIPDYAYNSVLIAKQARDKDINSIFLAPDSWETVLSQATNESYKSYFEGSYFCSNYSYENPSIKNKDFVSDYENKYKTEPSAYAALAYDSVNILLDAIENSKSNNKNDIIKALSETNYSGVTGQIKFDQDRNPVRDITVIKITNGENKFFKLFKADDLNNN